MIVNQKQVIENCEKILTENYKITKENKVLIIFDEKTILNQILTKGYVEALEKLKFDYEKFDFYKKEQDEIKSIVDSLKPKDLVILIQSNSFRMSKYRWRNLLYEKGLKVIEHPHLEKNLESEYQTYIDSLNYDLPYYRKIANFLKEKLKKANNIKIISKNGCKVEFYDKMDEVYENIAYFEDKKNWGTRFPVGEVLTESLDLTTLKGEFEIYAFPDKNHLTNIVEPFKCRVESGFLISHEGPKEFEEIFSMIKKENEQGKVFIRELGLGLNRGIKRDTRLGDVSSYERLEGVHFSLGMKHGIYQKKLWKQYGKKFYQRYHIDVFLDVDRILINDEKVYDKSKGYLVKN